MHRAIAVLALLLTSHCATSRPVPPAPAPAPPLSPEGVLCGDDPGPSPFHQPRALHLLVADFDGAASPEPDLPRLVSARVIQVLESLQEEPFREPEALDIHVPEGSLEIARLPCVLRSHAQAEAVARALDAEVVLWGQAFLNRTAPVVVNNHNKTTVDSVSVVDHGLLKVGTTVVHAPKPYTVRLKATLLRPEHGFHRDDERGRDVASPGHIDWRLLRETAPLQLLRFALGLHFHARKDYGLAARFFDTSAEQVLKEEREVEAFELALGETYLHLADPERALLHGRRAQEGVRGRGGPMEGAALTLIGRALQARGDDVEALTHFRRALSLTERALGEDHPESGAIRSALALAVARRNGWTPEGERGGAIVLRCRVGTCAGLLLGDWLVAYGEERLRDANHLRTLLESTSPERQVSLVVVRDGREFRLSARGGSLGAEFQ